MPQIDRFRLLAKACKNDPVSQTERLMFPQSRRSFLWQLGGGLGGIALSHLLGQERLLADAPASTSPTTDLNGGLHHRAKVKRVIQLFMNGGVSQVDTFDP